MPGPKPYYQPIFTENEMAKSRKIVKRHTAAHVKVQRAKLALLLDKKPYLSSPSAAQILGTHEQWVRKWRKRWKEKGFNLEDEPRTGRPRFFSPTANHPN